MLCCQLRSRAVSHPVGVADEAGHGHTWRSTLCIQLREVRREGACRGYRLD